MDQDAFRTTYREVNERFCAFEKSLLTNQCTCSQSERFCIAEREGVHCHIDDGQQRCLEVLDNLREQARFALRTDNDSRRTLPHGKAIRIQVGGMRGIYHVLNPAEPIPETVIDINAVLVKALEKYSDFSKLPFSDIMQQIAAYDVKKRSRRHKDK
ncbi:MAG: hypothetical protein HKP55_06300 [Gammaproteobacteria bacterium]|nr:hypothetical protein [Gammaproteobacteria bacterium]